MLDYFLEKVKKLFTSRLLPISIVYFVLFFVLVHRIFTIQIVESDTNEELKILKNTEEREIKSTRGRIFDDEGNILAYNELAYSIVIEDSPNSTSNEEKNAIIYKLIKIIEKGGDQIDIDFPIQLNKEGKFEFNIKGSALTRFLNTAYVYLLEGEKITKEELSKITAEEAFLYLRHGDDENYTKMFDISDEYTLEEALQIMKIRYAIFSNYPKYLQITVATQVSEETVAAVKENSRTLIGVDIKQDSYRVYNHSELFAHILGYTGKVSSEEMETMSDDTYKYSSNDYIGKSGIEKVFENELRGVKGKEVVTVNNKSRKVISVDETIDPIAGNDISLTINLNLQQAAYQILENKIAGVLLQNIVNSRSYGSKGESAGDIKIPIYEVYFALINNNILDITDFNHSDATNLEQEVYQKYQDAFQIALKNIKAALAVDYTTTYKNLSEEMQNYLSFIYKDVLVKDNVVMKSAIDKDDPVYKDYTNDRISLSEFLQYAISMNWIDLSKLDIGEEYFSADEIYHMLIDYICERIESEKEFMKLIYRNLVFSDKLSGKEICLLLFDQGVLEYNEEDVTKLQNNGTSYAYTFIREKIKNLEITPAQLALEPCSGSVIVTDPNTGAVKAMVSYPSYDNNKMANKVDAEYYAKLTADLASPLYNRATQSSSAPGSTFKMVSAIAGLSEGVVTTSELIKDDYRFVKLSQTRPPRCWYKPGHGKDNVMDALKDSCNYYFYEVGWRLGGGNFGSYNPNTALAIINEYATKFGLNTLTGIEIGETAPSLSSIDGVRATIGQDTFNFVPAQLSRYVSTIANGGNINNLTLFGSVSDKDGNVLKENKTTKVGDLSDINNIYWNAMLEGMRRVVNEGSIKSMFTELPVVVAGKTGTAQESLEHPNHALFVSFAPFDNPEIAVTTVIRNGYTSANAAEVSSEVYAYYYGEKTLDEIMSEGANLKNSIKGGD